MVKKFRIHVEVDSRPPFDGERYWRWEVLRDVSASEALIFASGWCPTQKAALSLARVVRQELRR